MLLPWILATHQFFMTRELPMVILSVPPLFQPEQYSWQIRLGTKNSCLGPVFVCFVSAFWKACVTAWKKQITFNSFLCDGSGGCEAQLQNTNRLNQTSRIINKHKPNCSFLTGAKGRRKQPGCDCPLWRYCSYSTGKTTFGTWSAIVNMQNTATKPMRQTCFMPLKQLKRHDTVFANTGLSPFVNTKNILLQQLLKINPHLSQFNTFDLLFSPCKISKAVC